MSRQDLGFTVRRADVEDARQWLRSVVERFSHVSVVVEADRWPIYAAALEANAFHAMRTPGGNELVYCHVPRSVMRQPSVNPAHVEQVMVWLNCYAPPAPWVRFPAPDGESTRTYKFNVTLID